MLKTLKTGLALLAIVAAACSHATTQGVPSQSGATKSESSRCQLSSADSVFLGGGSVYLPCAVDSQAKLTSAMPHPDIQLTRMPTGGGLCYDAEIEFVVGADGSVETAMARVTRTNDTDFGQALLATLSRRRYQAAMKSGQPVRQIVKEAQKAAVMVAEVGSKPRGRPPVC